MAILLIAIRDGLCQVANRVKCPRSLKTTTLQQDHMQMSPSPPTSIIHDRLRLRRQVRTWRIPISPLDTRVYPKRCRAKSRLRCPYISPTGKDPLLMAIWEVRREILILGGEIRIHNLHNENGNIVVNGHVDNPKLGNKSAKYRCDSSANSRPSSIRRVNTFARKLVKGVNHLLAQSRN